MHMKELNDFLFWHLYMQSTQQCADFPSYSVSFYLEDVYLILDYLTL